MLLVSVRRDSPEMPLQAFAKEERTRPRVDFYTNIHSRFIHSSQKTRNNPNIHRQLSEEGKRGSSLQWKAAHQRQGLTTDSTGVSLENMVLRGICAMWSVLALTLWNG